MKSAARQAQRKPRLVGFSLSTISTISSHLPSQSCCPRRRSSSHSRSSPSPPPPSPPAPPSLRPPSAWPPVRPLPHLSLKRRPGDRPDSDRPFHLCLSFLHRPTRPTHRQAVHRHLQPEGLDGSDRGTLQAHRAGGSVAFLDRFITLLSPRSLRVQPIGPGSKGGGALARVHIPCRPRPTDVVLP